MERLRLEELTAMQRIFACVAGVNPTEVDVLQDVRNETISALVYGKEYSVNCAGVNSVSNIVKKFCEEVVCKYEG